MLFITVRVWGCHRCARCARLVERPTGADQTEAPSLLSWRRGRLRLIRPIAISLIGADWCDCNVCRRALRRIHFDRRDDDFGARPQRGTLARSKSLHDSACATSLRSHDLALAASLLLSRKRAARRTFFTADMACGLWGLDSSAPCPPAVHGRTRYVGEPPNLSCQMDGWGRFVDPATRLGDNSRAVKDSPDAREAHRR